MRPKSEPDAPTDVTPGRKMIETHVPKRPEST